MSLRAGREYASTQCRPACPRPAPRGLTALRVAQGVAEDTHHGRIVDEVHTRVLQRSDTPQRHAWRVLVEPLPPAARVAHGLPHRSPRPRMQNWSVLSGPQHLGKYSNTGCESAK